MRNLLLALGQTAGNGLAHIAELDDLMRNIGVNCSGLCDGRFCAQAGMRGGGRNRVPAFARERFHISLYDTAIRARASD